MDDPDLPGLLVALGVALAASVPDVRERRIPNALNVVGLIVAAATAVVCDRWLDAVAGGVLGIGTLALPRLRAQDAVGSGDIKLAGVVGVGVGVSGVVAVLGVAVAAALVALGAQAIDRRAAGERQLPFAPYVALGVVGLIAITLAAGVG
ncbi:MAG: A24 family peptidase [Rhodospirillaceae bacterium]|nr:A24 family peptidase [Rhodospirillaceae bacterium]